MTIGGKVVKRKYAVGENVTTVGIVRDGVGPVFF